MERPEPGENETSGKSELEVEFERAEVERETKARESADIVERREIQDISVAVAVEVEAKPGSEPQ